MADRKYLPTLSELVDRLSIVQLKEVFIAEHKSEYAEEINAIVHDIQLYLNESKEPITAETIRAIVDTLLIVSSNDCGSDLSAELTYNLPLECR